MYIFKKHKIREFSYNHLNIEYGRKQQHVRHTMLYYLKKVNNANEMQKKKKKRFMQCMEKEL